MSGLLRGALRAVVAGVGMLGANAARAAILVDDFTQSIGPVWPQVQSVSTAGGAPESEAGLVSVLGGVRGYVVKSATIGVSGLDVLASNVFHDGTTSVIDYASSAGASGTVELFYGDTAANPLGLTGVGGVQFNFVSDDDADRTALQVLVTLSESTGPGTSISTFGTASLSGPGSQIALVTSFSPVALTRVDAIKVDFTAPAGEDFRLDSIVLTPSPEPASVGVLGVGAMMLLRRRR